jgi:2-hydroxychromene-2-carboxylate isomerase
MNLRIDVFWSFRSPWSYLATPRLLEWSRRYYLDVVFRPVYPIAVRTPEFFDRQHPLWRPYFMKDVFRCAEFLSLPLKWPKPDPVIHSVVDGKQVFATQQPLVTRLTRLGILAQEQGPGIEFADSVARLIWGGTENWHQGDHLARAAANAGLRLDTLDQAAVLQADRLEAEIARNQVEHASGHWGVPTCMFQGEPFFGQDRLDVLLWRLQQCGLQERAS